MANRPALTSERDLDQGYANDVNPNALDGCQVEGMLHVYFKYSLIWCKFRLLIEHLFV